MHSQSVPFLSHAERKFEYGGNYDGNHPFEVNKNSDDISEDFLTYIQDEIIGDNISYPSPFGYKKMIYCDYTASGKSLQFIENYIQDQVLPFYANTHTTTSISGRQSHFYRHEARDLIKHSIHGSEDDVLLFTGTGATYAIHKLITCLGLDQLSSNDLVVFLSSYEHHSNILPWRELGAKVITIPEDNYGSIDLSILEDQLQDHLNYRVKIGSFSVASNITGILSDQNTITALLHRYEALAFWDFAAAAPYVNIDMNPIIEGPDRHLVYKDAIFISPHKFIGGPGCPGILCAKRKLFQRPSPKECGGGTVFFVSRTDHRYLSSIEEREEGGTPDIIGSIRCGLVFQLKQQIGVEFIKKKEEYLLNRVKNELLPLDNFILLGSNDIDRLPILSFVIRHLQSGLYLHHNFVCSILNDVYGIQVRGGCVCAGPYAQELLGIDMDLSKRFENILLHNSYNDKNLEDLLPRERDRQGAGTEIFRPGFIRINFHYTLDTQSLEFIISALKQVIEHGWKLLPYYKFNPDTGEWLHKNWTLQKGRKWLGSIRYFNKDGKIQFNYPEIQHHPGKLSKVKSVQLSSNNLPNDKEEYFKQCIQSSLLLYNNPPKHYNLSENTLFTKEENDLRWFLLPYEANKFINGKGQLKNPPFIIKEYKSSKDKLKKDKKPKKNKQINTKHQDNKQLNKDNNNNNNNNNDTNDNDNILNEFSLCDDDSEEDNIKDTGGFKFHVPSKELLHTSLDALSAFNMINHGDRVIACISGGKDSLSMLHILKHYQYMQKAKGIEFDLAAATVDPMTHSTYNPTPLKVYMKALNVPYFYLSDSIMERAKNTEECKSICSYCSRMKRGMLQSCARKEGYNILALGQHLDDLAESFMMSLLHNGLLRTMKANYTNKEGDLRIIRPLVYTRERDLAKFAAEKKLPVIPENCPACFEAPKERHRIKQLLAAQENLHSDVFKSIKLAIKPLAAINKTGLESGTKGLGFLDNITNTDDNTDAEIIDY